MRLPSRVLPGRARNFGAAVTRGELLAFLDADAIPQAGWLDSLERALTPEVEMVAGAVLDGTPDERWGTVAYTLEYLEWVPERGSPLGHAAGCNLLIRREAFERANGFPEDLWPGEDTLLSLPFSARGTLAFAPGAQVRHLNRIGRREVLAHQRRLGSSWMEVCERALGPRRRRGATRFPPVAVAERVWSLVWQLCRQPGGFRRLVSHGPLILAGLVAWAAGVCRPRHQRVAAARDVREDARLRQSSAQRRNISR